MNSLFLAALDDEVAALEADLNQDVRFVRLRELRRVRALYETDQLIATQGSQGWVSKPPLRKTSPERRRALLAAKIFFLHRAGPIPTAEIYEHLKRLGVVIGGREPRNNLSAMLSNSGMFEANGRAGWTLKPQSTDEEEEQDEEVHPDADPVDRI